MQCRDRVISDAFDTVCKVFHFQQITIIICLLLEEVMIKVKHFNFQQITTIICLILEVMIKVKHFK